jgi:hypothetical protein
MICEQITDLWMTEFLKNFHPGWQGFPSTVIERALIRETPNPEVRCTRVIWLPHSPLSEQVVALPSDELAHRLEPSDMSSRDVTATLHDIAFQAVSDRNFELLFLQ